MSTIIHKLAPFAHLFNLAPTTASRSGGLLHHAACARIAGSAGSVELQLAECAARSGEFCRECSHWLTFSGRPLHAWYSSTKRLRQEVRDLTGPLPDVTKYQTLVRPVLEPIRVDSALTPWVTEIERLHAQRLDLERTAFTTELERPFLERILTEALPGPRVLTSDPFEREGTILLDAHAAAHASLLDTPRRALVHSPDSAYARRPEQRIITAFYALPAPDLFLMPMVALAFWTTCGFLPSQQLVLSEAPTPSELETFAVLFDPRGSAFSSLEATLAAVRAL